MNTDFVESLKLHIRKELIKLPEIHSIDGLRDLCENTEQKVLSLCISLIKEYADKLFESVTKKCFNDFIVDVDGNFYSIRLTDDLAEKTKLIVLINSQRLTSLELTTLDIELTSTGKYKKISVILPNKLIRSKLCITEFFKCIFETTYFWFKEQVLYYINNNKICVARKLYSYLHSTVENKKILQNFWFAIVGQGYGFRLLDYDLTLNAFELIDKSVEKYDGYTNRLVTELISTKLPTQKMLMQIAIDNKATLIGDLRKAVYTSEGSIYSTTLYTLYDGENFVIQPLYIDDFSILALYPLELKNEIEAIINDNKAVLCQLVQNEMSQLITAYYLFSNRVINDDISMNKISLCINKILSFLYQARISISKDASIDIYGIFKEQYNYDESVFNNAMKILKDNRYVMQDSSNNYIITDCGVSCLFKGGDIMSDQDKSQVFNFFGGNFEKSAIGSSFGGDMNNDAINMEAFNMILSQILEVAKTQNQFEQNIILDEIDKLRAEVNGKKPKKEVIKNVLDWMQKITSIAGFAITLNNILKPML